MEIAAVVWIFLLFVAGLAATVIAHPPPVTAGPAVTLLAVPATRPPPPPPGGPGGPAVPLGAAPETGPGPLPAEEVRYVDEVAVAAGRAAATAERLRDAWSAAQDEVDAAWAAYETADAQARRFAAAAA